VEAYPIAPIDWLVTDFVLVSSVFGQSRHDILDHWQLGRDQRQSPKAIQDMAP